MRELNDGEVAEVSGANFFNELGHAVGNAHNAADTAIGAAFSKYFGQLKNHMYQLSI